jgi:predicted nucleotidyltransferase
VRFLYARPVEWYLSIDLEHRRDVIEVPIAGNLDINGWDLRKALQLFRRSNLPLLEWLGSPIVYYERYTVAAKMRRAGATFLFAARQLLPLPEHGPHEHARH